MSDIELQSAYHPAASDGVTLGHRTFTAALLVFALVLTWAVGLTSYILCHDDVAAALMRRNLDAAATHDRRIATLTAELEAARTRTLVEQEKIERKIEALLKRQAAIESRQETISALTERPDGQKRADAGPTPASPGTASGDAKAPAPDRLSALHRALDRAERTQADQLARVRTEAEARARRLRQALGDLGLAVGPEADEGAMGGPFIPVAVGNPFDAQAHRTAAALGALRRLEDAIATLPVRHPLGPDADVTSGYGPRLDPFLHRPAHHDGIDFKAEPGSPVRATAAGRVKEAGWQGGYGNMVEIDHGHGVSTLFGHLSTISVRGGQAVVPGQLVGRVGSSGRSTGPHLHYETRIGGEALDPARFLRAGLRLGMDEAGRAPNH